MSYNEKQPFSVFIKKFNEISVKFDDFNNNYQQTLDTVRFIEDEIVPRYSGRPTIFRNIRAMQECNSLVENDVCIVFKESAPNQGESYVDIYKVRTIKDLADKDYLKLYDPKLGALELTVGISNEPISRPFIDGLFGDESSSGDLGDEFTSQLISNAEIDNVMLGNVPNTKFNEENTLISDLDIKTLVDN